MHKPFDLEAAKRGGAVEYRSLGDRWESCRFLGVSESGDGYLVIERINGGGFQLSYASPTDLRMAPKKVTVRYRVALCQGAHDKYVMAVQDSEQDPRLRACGFIDWLDADWQEVEIPQ